MRLPPVDREQSLADFFEWQTEQRYKARHKQVARRLGAGRRGASWDRSSAGNPRPDVGRSLGSDVHGALRRPSTRSPRLTLSVVRAAVSTPAELAVIVLLCVLVLAPFVWLGWSLGQR